MVRIQLYHYDDVESWQQIPSMKDIKEAIIANAIGDGNAGFDEDGRVTGNGTSAYMANYRMIVTKSIWARGGREEIDSLISIPVYISPKTRIIGYGCCTKERRLVVQDIVEQILFQQPITPDPIEYSDAMIRKVIRLTKEVRGLQGKDYKGARLVYGRGPDFEDCDMKKELEEGELNKGKFLTYEIPKDREYEFEISEKGATLSFRLRDPDISTTFAVLDHVVANYIFPAYTGRGSFQSNIPRAIRKANLSEWIRKEDTRDGKGGNVL